MRKNKRIDFMVSDEDYDKWKDTAGCKDISLAKLIRDGTNLYIDMIIKTENAQKKDEMDSLITEEARKAAEIIRRIFRSSMV